MRRSVIPSLAAVGVVAASLLAASPAQAHGYVSSPPSRQALCAQGVVSGCGDLVYEPQSVEAPKGSRLCSGGNSRFAVLDDTGRNWPATSVGSSTTFNWTLTARHATSTWEYFIGGTRIASFDDAGQRPGATVSHAVNFGGFTGRQTVLARWNIADTVNAFYACVDVQIGGGSSAPAPAPTTPGTPAPTATTPAPAPTTTAPGTTAPATTAPPATAPTSTGTAAPGRAWKAWRSYTIGQRVSYRGRSYVCRQSHTALPGWEPPYVLALWLPA